MNKNIDIAGKKIFYRVYGSGKTVVLIHGFGETGDVWKNQVEFFKDKFQLIVPDLPGSGQSEMIDDMSIEGMAEVIKIIIDTESPLQTSPGGGGFANPQGEFNEDSKLKDNLKKSESLQVPPPGGFRGALIGHSMGGYITLAFAEKYEQYLRSFGLFHSSAFADTDEKIAMRRKGIEFIKEHGSFEFLKTAIPNLFAPDSKSDPGIDPGIKELIEQGHNFSPKALVSYYESMIKRPDRTEVLKIATVPVLFVMGKYDNAIPLEDGLKQCYLAEKSYIHVLGKSGHMGMLEEPTTTNRLLEEFLSTS